MQTSIEDHRGIKMARILDNDDRVLIDETLQGRTASFGQVVVKYQDRLYNAMVFVAGNREDALDIVQEAFVRAFVNLHTFRGTASFYTWLYRIAFHEAVQFWRRRKPVLSLDQMREVAREEPVDRRKGPDRRSEQIERRLYILRALAKLDEKHRAVLVLRTFEGCSYEAIAKILDVPVGTVRSRLHRARLQLLRHLDRRRVLER